MRQLSRQLFMPFAAHDIRGHDSCHRVAGVASTQIRDVAIILRTNVWSFGGGGTRLTRLV